MPGASAQWRRLQLLPRYNLTAPALILLAYTITWPLVSEIRMKLLHDFSGKMSGTCLAVFEAQGSELSGNSCVLIDPARKVCRKHADEVWRERL